MPEATTDPGEQTMLPVPRPARRVGPVGATLARFFDGVAAVVGQIDPYAAYWDERNDDAVTRVGDDGWWAVLGDSTAQGIGASAPDQGWVGHLDRSLARARGPMPLVNLSVSGATTADVVAVQLPVLAALTDRLGPPRTVAVAVGANDVFRSPNLWRMWRSLGVISAAIPDGSVLGAVPEASVSVLARLANSMIAGLAGEHGHVVADVPRHYRSPFRGRVAQDSFHPNDRGHLDWARAFTEALAIDLVTPARRTAAT